MKKQYLHFSKGNKNCKIHFVGSRARRILVGGQPSQNLSRFNLKNKPGMVVHTCNSSYLVAEVGELKPKDNQGIDM
jgi:hypothetical protein